MLERGEYNVRMHAGRDRASDGNAYVSVGVSIPMLKI